jgi:hypothetical protein
MQAKGTLVGTIFNRRMNQPAPMTDEHSQLAGLKSVVTMEKHVFIWERQ